MTHPALPSWMRPPDGGLDGENNNGASRSSSQVTVEAVVVAREQLASEVVGFELEPTTGIVPRWEAGAHVDVHLRAPTADDPADLVRQYSLCGDPTATSLRIAVLRDPHGRGGSAHLHDAVHEGDRLRLAAPRNNFPLVPAPAYLFIGGGIGITPLLPMIEQARSAGAEWSLVYGGRSRSSMAFLDQVEQYPQTRIVTEDEHGLPDLTTLLARPRAGCLIYCCGPEALLDAVQDASAHWPAGSLHFERFRPRHDALDAPSQPFEVVLARTGKTLPVPAGRSILETLAEAGVTVLSSCREGTCGTCETDVVAGEVDHRDALLTDTEKAANDSMMICVSRAKGDRLVLDL